MRGRTIALAFLLLGGAAVGCTDDGGGSDADAQPYVDALASTLDEEDEGGPTAEQADCIAERTIEVIGVDRLEDEGITPEDIEGSEGPDDLGIELSDDDATDVAESFVDCGFSLAAAFAGPDAPEEVVECLEGAIDDDVVVEGLALSLQGRDDEADAVSEELFGALAEACPEAFGG